MDERTKLQIILNSYTSKILGYYMEHKQLPSIATMQQMREETIDEPPCRALRTDYPTTKAGLVRRPMIRRNFLSGLLAAPLALKARFVQLFGQSPVNPCAAPRFMLTDRQRQILQLLAEGKSINKASLFWPGGLGGRGLIAGRLQQSAKRPGFCSSFRRISLN